MSNTTIIDEEARAKLRRATLKFNNTTAALAVEKAKAEEAYRIALEEVFTGSYVALALTQYGSLEPCACGEALKEINAHGGMCYACYTGDSRDEM